MKKITFYLFALSVVISSCQNSEKLLNKGQYDAAMNIAARKLAKNKTNEKQIVVLEDAYKKSLAGDRARIDFLKQEGRPENWDEIFAIYSHITQKQNMIRPLLPLKLNSQNRDANFELIDVNAEMIAAKQKAAEFEYTAAMQLLDKKDKVSARNAFDRLQRVKSIYPTYKDVDDQLARAHVMGTTYIIYRMQNQSGILIPADFETELCKIALTDLNTTWLQYDTKAITGRYYDYTVLVNMKVIDVSPEDSKTNTFLETKDVPDGFSYAMDAKGNVRRDSAGNDIKIPKTKTISCAVTELHQMKRAVITGSLDYINNNTQQLMKSEPLMAETVFNNYAAKAEGDQNALKPETLAKLGNGPVPFPPSPKMILDAGQILKMKCKDIIYANKGMLY